VLSISPTSLSPSPDQGTQLSVTGVNFGAVPGSLTVGARRAVCLLWTDTAIACAAPPGVEATAALRVVAASTLASPAGFSGSVRYRAPAVSQVQCVVPGRAAVVVGGDAGSDSAGDSDGGSAGEGGGDDGGFRGPVVRYANASSPTEGGGLVNITGVNFGHPLPVSVWLVRSPSPATYLGPPWESTLSSQPGTSVKLRCPVVPGSVSATSVTCVVPEGSGTQWRVVVVNHDVADPDGAASPGQPPASAAVSLLRWQVSAAPLLQLHYDPPTVSWVASEAGPAPAAGGFPLRVSGTGFSPFPPAQVLVGTLACPVTPGSHSHTGFTCVAPPRQLDLGSNVTVRVDGQRAAWARFRYDPPRLHRTAPAVLEATAGDASTPRTPLTVYGENFGVRYSPQAVGLHRVLLGGLPCGAVQWVGDGEVTCTPAATYLAGPSNVTVLVGLEQDASTALPVVLQCPRGLFGGPGEPCTPCPANAECPGHDADPVALAGYFPLDRARFVACAVRAACVGGVNASALQSADGFAGCAGNYMGVRCAECRPGSYRRGGRCKLCPRTAFLLFLGFALAIVTAVAVAVYLSKKRINLAGLSVGVVRTRCPLLAPYPPCSPHAPYYTSPPLPRASPARCDVLCAARAPPARAGAVLGCPLCVACVCDGGALPTGLHASAVHVFGVRVRLATSAAGHFQRPVPHQLQPGAAGARVLL
jgi:hypothetical protein